MSCLVTGLVLLFLILMKLNQPRSSSVFCQHLHSDGRHRDILYVDGGPSMNSKTGHEDVGKEVFRHAVSKLGSIINEALMAIIYRAMTSIGLCLIKPIKG